MKISYNDRCTQLIQLAFLDESEDWETDNTGIYLDMKNHKFILLTTSGCSCWDGDEDNYEEIEFYSLEDLHAHLIKSNYDYNPSRKGIIVLIQEAIFNYLRFKKTKYNEQYVYQESETARKGYVSKNYDY